MVKISYPALLLLEWLTTDKEEPMSRYTGIDRNGIASMASSLARKGYIRDTGKTGKNRWELTQLGFNFISQISEEERGALERQLEFKRAQVAFTLDRREKDNFFEAHNYVSMVDEVKSLLEEGGIEPPYYNRELYIIFDNLGYTSKQSSRVVDILNDEGLITFSPHPLI